MSQQDQGSGTGNYGDYPQGGGPYGHPPQPPEQYPYPPQQHYPPQQYGGQQPGYGQYGQGQPPYYGGPPPPPQSIKVLGIINLVFGGFALCCGAAGGFNLAVSPEMNLDPGSMPYVLSMAGSVLIFLASAGFIAGGIGLIMNKRWGRLISMLAAFTVIAASLVEIPYGSQIALAEIAGSEEAAILGEVGTSVVAFGAITMCACAQSIYPIVLIIMLSMAKIRDGLD